MSGQSPTILVFGAEIGPETGGEVTPESDRVAVATIKANLKTVMEGVSEFVHATQKAVGHLDVVHVDVGVVVAADGSVGLLGSGRSTRAEATLNVRLQFRTPYKTRF